MARYVFLMYDAEDWCDTAGEQDIADEMRLYGEFVAAVRDAGASVLGGEAPQRSSPATTVRTGDGDALVTDGPFRRHQGGPRRLLRDRGPDFDVALRLARACPAGNVEVRPALETPDG